MLFRSVSRRDTHRYDRSGTGSRAVTDKGRGGAWFFVNFSTSGRMMIIRAVFFEFIVISAAGMACCNSTSLSSIAVLETGTVSNIFDT